MEDLHTLFNDQEQEITATEPIVAGLKISILEKRGLALTLIADHIFSPALVMSELIHLEILAVQARRVLDLGCGTGLVGLVALLKGAAYVALSDYNDEQILACPRRNLAQNAACFDVTKADVLPHTWGTDPSNLIRYGLPASLPCWRAFFGVLINVADGGRGGRFDVVILADILWYISSHPDILKSIDATLTDDGTVWISSGKYTTCALDFFNLAGNDWQWEEVPLSDSWAVPDTHGLANLKDRKRNCLCWKMQRRREDNRKNEHSLGTDD